MANATTDYFFCYSPRLKTQLLDAGERFICVGINESTQRKFWLFAQNASLSEVLADWAESRKQAQ